MSIDLERIGESKREHRRRVAGLPIGEKLRLLDALREREIALRGGSSPTGSPLRLVREQSVPYRPRPE